MTNEVPMVDVSSDNTPELTVDSAIANLLGDDAGLRFYAAWWLGKFRVREPKAIEALIDALGDERDRTAVGGYPLRRNAARALGKLGDRRAVSSLIDCLQCSDSIVRETATQALGKLGDASCVPELQSILDESASPQLCEAILEALGSLQATETLEKVLTFLTHDVERVQFAAARAAYQLTGEAHYAERLTAGLSCGRRRSVAAALLDLGAIGYIPAAEAIARAPAESSLRLVALKGLLERHYTQIQPSELSETAIALMALMDDLL